MHEKTLTVSIAGYNVESFIRQALESCLVPELDEIEIIVVDDGATDNTMSIADEYALKYPDSFIPIRKENEGYGTTLNVALEHARGQWFRPLDGDDWFDADSLSHLIRLLKSCDAELAITPYVWRYQSDKPDRVVDLVPGVQEGIHPFETLIVSGLLNMHSVTYRTDILRAAGLKLPAGRLYTDTLYSVWALPSVRACIISHVPLYQYRFGREGQSVSRRSMISHRMDYVQLIQDLVKLYYVAPPDSLARRLTGDWVIGNISSLNALLWSMPPSHEVWSEIKNLRYITLKSGVSCADLEAVSRLWRICRHVKNYACYMFFSRAYKVYSMIWKKK